MLQYYKTLSIAGSDSGGGAGIQADIKTFSALGCYGMSVITALTAQNTLGVQGILPIPPEFIRLQLKSILDDMSADAIKTGMLHSAEVIEAIVSTLNQYQPIPLIVDPVMIAKDGSYLLEPNAIEALKTQLFPITTLMTPNVVEAEALLNSKIIDKTSIEKAAKELTQWGSKAVLLKGGHMPGSEGSDCLYIKAEDRCYWLHKPTIKTKNTHGTGCTLSAAITAFIAQGFSLLEAMTQAKEYLSNALTTGADYQLGKGYGPVKHFNI